MASRVFDQLWGIGKSRVLLHGRFSPNGTGAVTNVQGAGFTAARTAVGTYTITLADKYPALLYADIKLFLATPTNQTEKILSYSLGAVGVKSTAGIAAWDPAANAGAGGAFDPAANAGTFFSFQFVFNNSTIALGG